MNLEQLLHAGLDAQGGNLILPVNPDALSATDPHSYIEPLREQTQAIRRHLHRRLTDRSSGELKRPQSASQDSSALVRRAYVAKEKDTQGSSIKKGKSRECQEK